MAPDVRARKLAYLRQLIDDLAPYAGASQTQIEADHYKVERLFELLVMAASDLLFHLLAERGEVPDSYRAAFKRAAEEDLIPAALAERLQDAASMRNVLVHMYEEIDYEILRASIEPAVRDFSEFTAIFAQDL